MNPNVPDNPARVAGPGELPSDRYGISDRERGWPWTLDEEQVCDYIARLKPAEVLWLIEAMLADEVGSRWVYDWLIQNHGDQAGCIDLRRFLP
ncbi:MAG: hypothetical protein IT480_12800 [Gammaproteobacteria bacterium]|nr:hypothetical protein [Gammaproteobacteria bacterium]